ncbi:MAG: hypothetical protein Q7U16_14475 [Agitococcus sp.]|nr:hypothetical protein [Agitococcus sp.]
MLYLLDSDAAKKLCQYNLIADLATALRITLADFAVLPQLKFQLHVAKPDKSLKKLGSPEAVTQLKLLLENASEIEIGHVGAALMLTLNRPDIDSGEQLLFLALTENKDSGLVTGDKRALVALSKINDSQPLAALWVRIMCLEDALLLLATVGSFDSVSIKVRQRPDVDTAISLAFGRQTANTQEGVIEGLASYIRALQQSTNGTYKLGGTHLPLMYN